MKKRENEEYAMGQATSTSFRRKRIALSSVGTDQFTYYNDVRTTKRLDSIFCTEKSALEDLPHEILMMIVCGVEHDDLKSLFFVSKAMREVTLMAKESHFACKTPRKMLNLSSFEDFNDVEAPNAPKQSRVPRSRLCAKKLTDISVALFSAENEENWWPRKDFVVKTEI